MHDKIFELLFEEDEITWQSIIYDLIRAEKMDPWDVDVSLLSQKYIDTIKKLKEMDFRVSGKVLLAAAILLKIKSSRLVDEDINELDRLIFSQDEMTEEEFYEELETQFQGTTRNFEQPILIPKTPQPRKRKVSIYDLVAALEQALEVKRRRVISSIPTSTVELPEKKVDISDIIKQIYSRIVTFFSGSSGRLTFSQLIPSDNKEDKVYTFIPLLHLTTQRKIDMLQQEHFGEIEIQLLRQLGKRDVDRELSLT
jgi:segregation and condensation protein A